VFGSCGTNVSEECAVSNIRVNGGHGSSKALVPMYQIIQHDWLGQCSGTALDLYSAGAWFESWSGQVSSLMFLWFSSFLRQMLG